MSLPTIISPPDSPAGQEPPGPARIPDGPAAGIVSYAVRAFESEGSPRLFLPPVRRWLALGRRNIYWMEPAFGSDLAEVLPETQFFLAEHDGGHFSVVLPLIDGDLRFCLQGDADGLRVAAHGDIQKHPRAEVRAVYAAGGSCPFALIETAVDAVARHLKTFLPRREKPSPGFLDHFGWCTWNAFYDKVTAEKIVQGLESWKSRQFLPGLLVVDDGWLDRCGDYLNEFAPSSAVFPGGLDAFSKLIRRDYGVKMFGIWHAFQGYWCGINPDGPLALRFRTVANRGRIRPWEEGNGRESDLFLVHPEDAARFYADFYRFLRACGIDFVKVDGQSATEVFSDGVLGRVDVMKAYQQAFQAAGLREFGVELLHCMAHGNDVIWHCRFSNAMRSSDDYRPFHEDSWQQRHLVDNAYNSLLIAQVAVPDWDMFQSNRAHSAYHAAARALSGGPIYVSDEPGEQNTALLEKLVWFDQGTMRSLRCPNPALVTRDRLLTDCRRENRLLKIFNTVNGIGLLGLFHVGEAREPITDTFSASDVNGLEGGAFVVWRQKAEELTMAKGAEEIRLGLEFLDYEIAVISPLREGFAMLGLLDKFNPPAAVRNIIHDGAGLHFDVLDGGRAGLYSATRPRRVEVNGVAAPFEYEGGLVVVRTPARRVSSLVVAWE